MNIFDALPCYLQTPPAESVFIAMVRTLLEAPDRRMSLAEFGRLYDGAKKVFLAPFFKVTDGDRAEIALRYLDIPEPALCARRHWEMRSELTCRKGHSLIKVTDDSNLICTCFSCKDKDSNGYYRCEQCSAFQVCADCMVHAAQPEPAPPVHAAQPEAAPPVAKNHPN